MASLQKRNRGVFTYLYLDWSTDNIRHQEALRLKIHTKPKSERDRTHNRQVLQQAEALLGAKVMELNGFNNGLVSIDRNKDVITGFAEYAHANTKGTGAYDRLAAVWFARYCTEVGKKYLGSATLEVRFIEDYAVWLNHQTVRYRTQPTLMAKDTRIKLFRRLKRYLTTLYRDKYLSWPPQLIRAAWKSEKPRVKKPTPTAAELEILKATPMPHDTICRAWLFCAHTGLDHRTVSTITWSAIANGYLSFTRSKTARENKVKLSPTAQSCLPQREGPKDLVFPIPQIATAQKWVRKWFVAAKLMRLAGSVTWHSARHTLGMILGNEKGVPIEAISSIYGHSSILQTSKYLVADRKAADEAIDKMG